jgi:hypothetical protein
MLMIALCSSLIGAVLGTRLRVYVLFPAITLGVLLVAAVAAIKGSTVFLAISAALVWTICLQLGYFGGLLTRLCLAVSRLQPQRSLRSTIASRH